MEHLQGSIRGLLRLLLYYGIPGLQYHQPFIVVQGTGMPLWRLD